jgi:hypothetical protein
LLESGACFLPCHTCDAFVQLCAAVAGFLLVHYNHPADLTTIICPATAAAVAAAAAAGYCLLQQRST